MLTASVNGSPSLSPFSSIFIGLITTDQVKSFKPGPVVYAHLLKNVGELAGPSLLKPWEHDTVFLVSGNLFDIVGAQLSRVKTAPLRTLWIDQTGAGWSDKLGHLAGLQGGPDLVANGVDEAVKAIKGWRGNHRRDTDHHH